MQTPQTTAAAAAGTPLPDRGAARPSPPHDRRRREAVVPPYVGALTLRASGVALAGTKCSGRITCSAARRAPSGTPSRSSITRPLSACPVQFFWSSSCAPPPPRRVTAGSSVRPEALRSTWLRVLTAIVPCCGRAHLRRYINLVFARSCYDLTKLLSKTHVIKVEDYMEGIPEHLKKTAGLTTAERAQTAAAAAASSEADRGNPAPPPLRGGAAAEASALKSLLDQGAKKTEEEDSENEALLKYIENRWRVVALGTGPLRRLPGSAAPCPRVGGARGRGRIAGNGGPRRSLTLSSSPSRHVLAGIGMLDGPS